MNSEIVVSGLVCMFSRCSDCLVAFEML